MSECHDTVYSVLNLHPFGKRRGRGGKETICIPKQGGGRKGKVAIARGLVLGVGVRHSDKQGQQRPEHIYLGKNVKEPKGKITTNSSNSTAPCLFPIFPPVPEYDTLIGQRNH